MKSFSDERGFALAAAVFAMVVIGTLVAAAMFAARQELYMGRSAVAAQRAFGAAEAGLGGMLAGWNTGAWNALATGDSATSTGTLPAGSGTYTGSVRRLNQQLFLVRSTGQDPRTGSVRTLATVTRLNLIQMTFRAALTTRGQLKIGGSSYLDGANTSPSGWGCPAATDTLAGVTLPDSTDIQLSGCSGYACINGKPKILPDPTITDSTFFQFGDMDWNALVASATKVYPTGNVGPLNNLGPVGTATTCDASQLSNWGEPWSEVAGCRSYFPIIYVNGNLQITGGRGQGILLVSGDLSVQGGFQFYGPVIVRGRLQTTGTGGHFTGGVMAANVDLDLSTLLGNAVVSYSSCVLEQTLQMNATGRPIRERSWVELF